MEFKAEDWRHSSCRSTKDDGIPVFDGRKWVCSRCGTGMVVNDQGGVSREEAEAMFRQFLAGVSFKRREDIC